MAGVYVSDEPGRNEVYIERYPQGDRVQVSTTGGGGPVWRGDGKEIYFQTAIGGVPKVMAASVSVAGDRLAVGKPVPLFDMRVTEASGVREQFSSSSIVGRRWDVFPDGQHFLASAARTGRARAKSCSCSTGTRNSDASRQRSRRALRPVRRMPVTREACRVAAPLTMAGHALRSVVWPLAGQTSRLRYPAWPDPHRILARSGDRVA